MRLNLEYLKRSCARTVSIIARPTEFFIVLAKTISKVDYTCKFKARLPYEIYNRGENPILFYIKARLRGTYLMLYFDCAPTDYTLVKR